MTPLAPRPTALHSRAPSVQRVGLARRHVTSTAVRRDDSSAQIPSSTTSAQQPSSPGGHGRTAASARSLADRQELDRLVSATRACTSHRDLIILLRTAKQVRATMGNQPLACLCSGTHLRSQPLVSINQGGLPVGPQLAGAHCVHIR